MSLLAELRSKVATWLAPRSLGQRGEDAAAKYPAEAVDNDKQRRLTRLALAYLKRHDLLEYSARFDIVAITWPDKNSKPTIEHFKNAFEPIGVQGMFS